VRWLGLVGTLVVVALLSGAGQAQTPAGPDWPQWRGPSRDGVVAAAQAPTAWPASLATSWRADVGEGFSSPVVAAGRVFVHSRRDPQEIVTALDLASGRVLWRHEYAAAYQKNQYAAKMAKGPNATPLVAGGRVFTIGATGILTAWDAASGKRLWGQDYSSQVDFSKLFCGTAASPLLANGRLIVQVGSDVHGGRVLALDPATGATVWSWRSWTGPGPGYASPILATIGGVAQIVTLTNSSIVAMDAAQGAQLWTSPFPDEWHENIVTPIWTGTHLIVSGTRQGTQAYTIARAGGAWTVTRVWQAPASSMYMSSPVVADGVVYGLSDKRRGHFVALDVATGAVRWSTEGREGEHASVLLTPAHVIFLTNANRLIVARRSASAFSVEHQYTVGQAETWAVPVLVGRDLVIRDAAGVMRLAGH
jgi:outer membrane protein assembly factor BamB